MTDEVFLIQSLEFLERIDEQQLLSGRTEFQAHAALQKGHINWLMDRHDLAESSFRTSVEMLQALSQSDPKNWTFLALSNVCNSLSCLLGETGNFFEAAEVARIGIDAAKAASNVDPGNMDALWVQAIGYRNLSIAEQSMGNEGTIPASQSASLFSKLCELTLQSPTIEQLPLLECTVDAYQVLAWLFAQSNDLNKAREFSIRSLRELDQLTEFSAKISEREGKRVPWLKYRQVENQLRKNMKLGRHDDKFVISQTNAIDPENSQWVLLNRLSGRALHPELLEEGMIPGEFHDQDAIALVWPEEPFARKTAIEVISSLYKHVQIVLLVQNSLLERQAQKHMRREHIPMRSVTFVSAPTDTLWLRDFGPLGILTVDGRRMSVDATYNLIGGNQRFQDDNVPVILGRTLDIPTLQTPINVDWGAMAFNGSGLVVVSQSVLEMNRQIGFDEHYVTNTLKRLTGVEAVVYVEPLQGEPTGHVDWFMTFTSSDTLVIGEYTSGDTANAKLLDQHARTLNGVPTKVGPLKVVRIPMPPRGETWFGGTYTNVVFANGVLLVPSWPKSAPQHLEQEALDVYSRLLPKWKIVSIDSDQLGFREGSLHCMTINIPTSAASKRHKSKIQTGIKLLKEPS